MCIRSLEADIDRDILKINGREVQEPVVVTFPGPDGWSLQKLFNADQPIRESINKLTLQSIIRFYESNIVYSGIVDHGDEVTF